jgi:hypothetical protein
MSITINENISSNPLSKKVDCIFDYPIVETGWIVKRWFPVDLDKLRDWHSDLMKNYSDWVWRFGDHNHMWKYDANKDLGNPIKDDSSWMMLTWGDDTEGPVPWMRYIAKPEHDAPMPRNTTRLNEGLGARKCLYGYGLEILENMPAPPHDVQVAIHSPGTRLPPHQDGHDKFRFHIPIYTNPDARFIINGVDLHIPADGWCYIVNTTYLHSTDNQGDADRIHIYGNIWVEDVLKLTLDEETIL